MVNEKVVEMFRMLQLAAKRVNISGSDKGFWI